MNPFKCDYASRFRILKGGKISMVVSAVLTSVTLANAAPSGEQIVSGDINIDRSVTNQTNVNQNSHKGIINWQDFSVGANHTVNFNQPNSSSVTLNRVVGSNPSEIYGNINANGQVFLVNQNGILFGQNAQVNVGGLVASTLDIKDQDFLDGNYVFEGNSDNAVINFGTITTDNAYTVLLAKTVQNEGVIKATLGQVHLASGEKITLDINGNSLVKLTIDKGTLDGLVENKGAIYADGGQVYMTTQALDEVLNGLVNNTGVIEANTIEEKEGKIILFAHGGTGEFGGELNAKSLNSGDGGFIETSGTVVKIDDNIKVNTLATDGKAGKWLIDPNDFTIASSGGDMTAATVVSNLATTNFEIETATMGTSGGSGNIYVNENITWSNATKLTLTAENEVHVNAIIENTNTTDGGVYFNALNNTDKVIFDTNAKVIVNNVNQLQWIETALNGKYELGSNINASDTVNWNSGSGWHPISAFTGSLDGQEYTISNLFIDRPDDANVGFFGVLDNATVQNLNILNADVTGRTGVGVFVGKTTGTTTITNAHVSGKVTGAATGGASDAGGFVGYAIGLNITQSSAAVDVTAASRNVGGFVGDAFGGSYQYVLATGNATSTGRGQVGGFGGLVRNGESINLSISDSYALGNATQAGTADQGVGGFIGRLSSGDISRNYSVGEATGGDSNDGGFIGSYTGGTLADNFWDTQTSSHANATGSGALGGVAGLTTEQMKTGTNFTNWNFGTDPQNWVYSSELTYGGYLTHRYTGGFAEAPTTSDGIALLSKLSNLVWILENSERWSESYALTNSINAVFTGGWDSNKGWTPLGNTTTQYTGEYFVGSGDSTISNLTINRPNTDYVGFFGYTDGVEISNFGLVNANVIGNHRVGGLIGYGYDTTLENVYVTGSVEGRKSDNYTQAGGVAGYLANSDIYTSYSSADVTGAHGSLGGLVGYFTSDGGEDYYISDSYSTGTITSINNNQFVGGLVGEVQNSIVKNSFAMGMVNNTETTNVGGLVGGDNGGTNSVENSYWDTQTTGQNNSAVGGIGKTTAQMKLVSTFTGWSDGAWTLADGSTVEGYSTLRPYLTSVTRVEDRDTASTLFESGWGNTDGDGAYTITNASQLQNINLVANDGFDFELSNAIDLNDVTWTPIGDNDTRFSGNFDGKNNTLSNLTINSGDTRQGLFGVVSDGSIKNLTLSNVSMQTSNNYIGTLVGLVEVADGKSVAIENITLNNSNITSSSGRYIGGLIGAIENSDDETAQVSLTRIEINDLDIDANGARVGGLVGRIKASSDSSIDISVENVMIRNLDIEVLGTQGYVGGIAGEVRNEGDGEITLRQLAVRDGDIKAVESGYVGGLVGRLRDNSLLDERNLFIGSVEGGHQVGGLVGRLSSNSVLNFGYVHADVTGHTTGENGEVGIITGYTSSNDQIVTEIYAVGTAKHATEDATVATRVGVIGHAGSNDDYYGDIYYHVTDDSGLPFLGGDRTPTVVNATELTQAQMQGTQAKENMVGVADDTRWDFDNDWLASKGAYPIFKWEAEVFNIAYEDTTPAQTPTPTTNNNEEVSKEVASIVNTTSITPRVPTVQARTQTQTAGAPKLDISQRRVQSSITPTATPQTAQAPAARTMSDTIKIASPALSDANPNATFTVVGKTDGQDSQAVVTLDELSSASGGSEGSDIRVALSPDSFVELVNGGVNLPAGVSQEFYVVQESE